MAGSSCSGEAKTRTAVNYKIWAALAEEENEGWVWFTEPALEPRTLVKIHNPKNGRTIFCQSRHIETNFLTRYNEKNHTLKINDGEPAKALVISAWYRDALGGLETQSEVCLCVSRLRTPLWRDLRVACHHPDIVARIGTRLGILGVWLGLVSLLPAILDFADLERCAKAAVFLAFAALFAAIGYIMGRGPATG